MLRGLLVLGLSVASLAGGGEGAADPVVGLWSYGAGIVAVAPAGAGFTATVVKAVTFAGSPCTHRAGEPMWRLQPSADGYTGTHRFLQRAGVCSAGRLGNATWSLEPDGQTLHFCAADPGAGTPTPANPSSRCVDFDRAPAGSFAGSWLYSGGVLRVVGSLPRLLGTIVEQTRFSVCPHPQGEVVWEVTGGGGGIYTGTNLGFAGKGCGRREKHRAVFAVTGDTLYVRIARRPKADPGRCGRTTDCLTLERAAG